MRTRAGYFERLTNRRRINLDGSTARMTPIRDQEAGVTLIEMLVRRLSLFALAVLLVYHAGHNFTRGANAPDGRLEPSRAIGPGIADLRDAILFAGGPRTGGMTASGWCPVHLLG